MYWFTMCAFFRLNVLKYNFLCRNIDIVLCSKCITLNIIVKYINYALKKSIYIISSGPLGKAKISKEILCCG